MIDIISLYNDTAFRINKEENGYLSYADFNALSRLAENRLLDYISGDIENQKPPIPYLSQKNRDWLAPFIVDKSYQVENGFISRPDDYYGWEGMYQLGSVVDCDEDVDGEEGCNTPIELVSGYEFNQRCGTFIEGLQPSAGKPIVKEIGSKFYFMPKTIGSVVLDYIRYPIYGQIRTKIDSRYNDEVPDAATSIPYEWQENAREALVFMIVDQFSNHVREAALKQFNQSTGKMVRDTK